jgi:hypothetical protein
MAIRVFHGTLPDGYSIKTFSIREKTNRDTFAIEANMKKLHPDSKEGSFTALIELVRILLVKVDGQEITKGVIYRGVDDWTEGTLMAVAEAYFDNIKAPEGKATGEMEIM